MLKSKISSLQRIRNGQPEYVAGPMVMAEVLRLQYQSVFTTPMPRSTQSARLCGDKFLLDLAHMTPIFKGGDKSAAKKSSCRPHQSYN